MFDGKYLPLMKKSRLIPLFLALATTLFAAPAPDFTVTTSDGQTRKLYQDYVNQQKVLVLEIFFTTCPPCAAHAPHWQTLYQNMQAAYPGQVEFMLLSDKNADTDPVVNAYLAAKGLTMPAAGSAGGSLAAIQPYKNGNFGLFYGTPTFVVIAPGTGEVFFDIRGNSAQETMSLLGQKVGELVQQDCFLKSYFDNPVPDVEITVEAPAFDTTFSASGTYSVSLITELQGASYTITPFKDDNPLQGISTWDLVLMSKHILGITPLTAPWQLIAADMNCSGSITTFDIIEGRKLILGISTALSGCGGASWRFVADPDTMPSDGACVNFRGVKLGDLTGPYFAPDDQPDDRASHLIDIADLRLESGHHYRIPLIFNADMSLAGIQMAFSADPRLLKIRRIESPAIPGFGDQYYHRSEKIQLSLSWSTPDGNPVGLRSGEVLFVLEVEALQDARLSEILDLGDALQAEVYDLNGKTRRLELGWREVASPLAPGGIRMSPNPAHEVIYIDVDSGRDSAVLLQLMDIQGKIVLENEEPVGKGPNRIALRPDALLSGLFLLKMDGVVVGKICFGG